MTVIDTADLFSPALRRERLVDWQAPGPAAKLAAGMSGMEAMRAIRDGILPPPPLARLIGFRMAVVEPQRIVMELEPRREPGKHHRSLARRDRRGPARHRDGLRDLDHAAARPASVTLDLKLTYLRPLSVRSGTIRRKARSSSLAARPATPRASFATARAILQCTRPQPSR